jgi:hypothetical protein
MERDWYDNEFEKFLQDEVTQHRMYPSDKVWRNINKELHGEKRWPALTIVAIFLIFALTISTLLNRHPWTPLTNQPATASNGTAGTNGLKKQPAIDYKDQLSAQHINERTFAAIRQKQRQQNQQPSTNTDEAVVTQDDLVTTYQPLLQQPESIENLNSRAPFLAAVHNKMLQAVQSKLAGSHHQDEAVATSAAISHHTKAAVVTTDFTKLQEDVQVAALTTSVAKSSQQNVYEKPVVVLANKGFSRFEIQGYITPSMSYRRLADDKQRNSFVNTMQAPPAADNNTNVNDVVRHKPAMGLEAGVTVSYSVTKRLKIKSGLQFNVRQYYIDAYKGNYGAANIAVVTNTGLDTIRQYSSFTNNGGYKEATLDNKLYQLSLPIGLQWDVLKGKRLGVSLEGSIQPTFTLNKNLYIISTDYKFYTDGTPFFRTWNINSSVGINLTYRVGKSTWYMGPQFRYQHLPTYSDAYPIKEFRYDYGLKIGFTTPL